MDNKTRGVPGGFYNSFLLNDSSYPGGMIYPSNSQFMPAYMLNHNMYAQTYSSMYQQTNAGLYLNPNAISSIAYPMSSNTIPYYQPVYQINVHSNQQQKFNIPKVPITPDNKQTTTQSSLSLSEQEKPESQHDSQTKIDIKFDAEKFQKSILNNNGRKDEWHLLLCTEDRKQVDEILKEATDFEIHFINFKREFNKMSQTTTNIGNKEFVEYSSMWNSWKENLLDRQKQMLQLQEQTLAKFYLKVYPNISSVVQNVVPTESNGITANSTFTSTGNKVDLEQEPVPKEENQLEIKSEDLSCSLLLKNNKSPAIESLANNDQLKSNNISEQPKEINNDEDNETKSNRTSKTKHSVSCQRLDIQEKYQKSLSSIFACPQLAKAYNDFVFLRSEIHYIHNFISKIHLGKFQVAELKKNQQIEAKKNKMDSVLFSKEKDTIKQIEQNQMIKIQVTNHGRKVADSRNKDQLVSVDVPSTSNTDPSRTNIIPVRIVRDDFANRKSNDKIRSLANGPERDHEQLIPSSYMESTYYDDSLDSCVPPSSSNNQANIWNLPTPQEINKFIERERQNLMNSSKPKYTDPHFFTKPRKYTEEPLYIKHLLDFPARSYRPNKIVFILRGLPGSGKSYLARLIKEKEEQNNSLVKSRLLSLDDYFLVEREDSLFTKNDKRYKKPALIMIYEYDPTKENDYKYHLFKEFKKITLQGYYNFIIVDSINPTINDVRHFYACAIENNYIPYVIETEAIIRRLLDDCVEGEKIIAYCYNNNRHGRSLEEIRSLYEHWELLPMDYLRVDAYSLMSKHRETRMKRVEDDNNKESRWTQSSSIMVNNQPPGRWIDDSDNFSMSDCQVYSCSKRFQDDERSSRSYSSHLSYTKRTRLDDDEHITNKDVVIKWQEPSSGNIQFSSSYSYNASYRNEKDIDNRRY